MKYWLMKSEPDEFSIDDLAQKSCEIWDGIRNFQAKKFLQAMSVGDEAFFYHSSCKAVGIVGQMKIVRTAYPDPLAVDPNSPYFDPKSENQNRWVAVDVEYVKTFTNLLPLKQIKSMAKSNPRLASCPLLTQSRLSVMPIEKDIWDLLQRELNKAS